MRIAVLGGGPGGLYFAALAKQLDPRHEVHLWERNAPGDTFGFGVVFSDETLGGIEHADAAVFAAMERDFARWDDIDVHYHGTVLTSGGHGFAAMSRHRLLAILQQRCAQLGVRAQYSTPAPDAMALSTGYDLVVAADGANSLTRSRLADVVQPDLEMRNCAYIWLGTDLVFDAFKFYILDTPAGVMQVHGYPYSRDASTFILEAQDDVWRRAGFAGPAAAAAGLPPGRSDEASIEIIRGLCADVLGGHEIIGNNSRWVNFTTVRCARWHARQRRADRRRRAHRPLLHRLGHQAGHGRRPGAGRVPARAERRPGGAGGLRGRAPARGRLHPAGGAGQPGVVRAHRLLHRAGA